MAVAVPLALVVGVLMYLTIMSKWNALVERTDAMQTLKASLQPPRRGVWERHFDVKYDKFFFHDQGTGKSIWDVPPEWREDMKNVRGRWRRIFDSSTGSYYFHDEAEPGSPTTWNTPKIWEVSSGEKSADDKEEAHERHENQAAVPTAPTIKEWTAGEKKAPAAPTIKESTAPTVKRAQHENEVIIPTAPMIKEWTEEENRVFTKREMVLESGDKVSVFASRNGHFGLLRDHLDREAHLYREMRSSIVYAQTLSKKAIVVDIGGNHGLYSLAAARAGAKIVHCIEPQVRLAKLIKRSVQENNFDSIIKVYHAAIGNGRAVGRLMDHRIGEGGIGRVVPNADGSSKGINIYPVTSIPDVAKELISFLKIDVEGADLAVMKSTEKLFQLKRVICSIVEFGPPSRWRKFPVQNGVPWEELAVTLLESIISAGYDVTVAQSQVSHLVRSSSHILGKKQMQALLRAMQNCNCEAYLLIKLPRQDENANRAKKKNHQTSQCQKMMRIKRNQDILGFDLGRSGATKEDSLEECCRFSLQTQSSGGFVFSEEDGSCWLKSSLATTKLQRYKKGFVTGIKH